MRITQNIIYNTYVSDMMRRQASIYETSLQLATGKRVNKPSDDPVNASKILSSKSLMSSYGQYEKNIDSGLSYLSMAEQTLGSVKDLLIKIQETAVSESTGTADAVSRANAATLTSGMYDQFLSLANTSYDGKYIFGGYKTATSPFDTAGAYSGDANKHRIMIGAGNYVTIGVNGGEVFKGAGGGTDIFQTITDLTTALNANDQAGVQASIGSLEAAFSQVSNAVSDIGGKVTRLTDAQSDMSSLKVELAAMISGLEDVDLAKVMTELQLDQVALQAAMTSAGNVFRVNIFDYI
ncbi:MAG: flagellar hook-associated protein FlgL [Deltaproteobacteria bacterium]|nr:flagellar hook-associated protein FlgL [Deltaproteobacteria bacterium]